MKVPSHELRARMDRFLLQMETTEPGWEIAAFFGKLNLYYFTGTMQDGMLLIPRRGDPVFWVRRSYERALAESCFPDIRKMNSFRDAAAAMGQIPETVHLEMELVPLALLQRLKKHLPFSEVKPVDAQVMAVREVKSPYEIGYLRQAGKIHRHVLEDCVPDLLTEGISEAEFGGDLYALMVREGHQGIVRFGMFNTEMAVGQIGFGESSIYPTSFDGPGGSYGMYPAVPLLGSRERRLTSGDLVFVDVGCGFGGYNTDKTMTYMFGEPLPDDVIEVHHRCVAIQDRMASLLRPGAVPSEIYTTVMDDLDPGFLQNFMGYDGRQVRFLGHSIGLQVDETPVIARGFDRPIQEGMVFALEPKKGVPGVGMVGIENTYLVTPAGGECLTGESLGLIPVF
ncbi:M24 family metallopeptidase [Methanosphaerula subterraneus]|uniref:M24 family metallopeptidase n=1 Tax=Methanosphaerula subterraneus TaxID=3350244 RepID=UPI003F850E44